MKIVATVATLLTAPALAGAEPVELTESQLDAVTAGGQHSVEKYDGHGRQGFSRAFETPNEPHGAKEASTFTVVRGNDPNNPEDLNFHLVITPGTGGFDERTGAVDHTTIVSPF